MVKVQKPAPKSFKNVPNKPNKGNGVKKEKPAKEGKALPASNVTAKKAKIRMIEKAVQEKQLEQVKPTLPNSKKDGKKNKQKKEQIKPEVSVKKVDATPSGGKKNKAAGAEQKPKQVQKTAPTVEDKPPQEKVSKVQGKKAAAAPEGKSQQNPGKKQKKNVAAAAENKSQQQSSKKQKKESNDAAKSQQKLGKKQKKAPKAKKDKKTVTPSVKFEAQPFDEEQFNKVVNLENIKKISQALKSLVEKEVSEKKTSIFSDYRYFLNVSSYKIPNCPKRVVKLNLKHSLVNPEEDDVVIIVPDLQRGAKVDYDPTIQHYEDLFREAGVANLKIVPFNQLRKECTTFETKRKFASTYDYFLCDGRIVGHVVGFCGTPFQKPRTTFHAVRLTKTEAYKQEIEHALKRTAYRQLTKGDLISIPVGNHRYSTNELAENVQFVIEQLKTLYPGGLGNVRQMHLKIDITGTSAIPLYANLAGPPAETPNVIGLREQRMLKLKKEANEVLGQFNLSKTGDFIKLDKEQVERKRQIQDARKVLLADVVGADDETEETPAKKSKKDKKEKLIEAEEEEVAEEDDDEDQDDDDEEDQDDDDDEEEDDDDDEGEDDDDDDDDE